MEHFSILDNFVNSILRDDALTIPPEEGLETVRILKEIESIMYVRLLL
jgi:hypothetical protein